MREGEERRGVKMKSKQEREREREIEGGFILS